MTVTTRHVIFGTGAIGLATLDALRSRGETVRLVNRSGHAPVADDVEVVGGDAADPAFTTAVSAGARVVYQSLGPAAIAGKTATVLGDPDQPHTYTYVPDIGEGLAVLGEHPDAPGLVWHLPNDPDTHTPRHAVGAALASYRA